MIKKKIHFFCFIKIGANSLVSIWDKITHQIKHHTQIRDNKAEQTGRMQT